MKPPTAFTRRDSANYFTHLQDVVCSTCKAEGKFVLRKQCSKCGYMKLTTTFRKTQRQLSSVCKECEMVVCSACSADVRASAFSNKKWWP